MNTSQVLTKNQPGVVVNRSALVIAAGSVRCVGPVSMVGLVFVTDCMVAGVALGIRALRDKPKPDARWLVHSVLYSLHTPVLVT